MLSQKQMLKIKNMFPLVCNLLLIRSDYSIRFKIITVFTALIIIRVVSLDKWVFFPNNISSHLLLGKWLCFEILKSSFSEDERQYRST